MALTGYLDKDQSPQSGYRHKAQKGKCSLSHQRSMDVTIQGGIRFSAHGSVFHGRQLLTTTSCLKARYRAGVVVQWVQPLPGMLASASLSAVYSASNPSPC